jgi:hypothetical protein
LSSSGEFNGFSQSKAEVNEYKLFEESLETNSEQQVLKENHNNSSQLISNNRNKRKFNKFEIEHWVFTNIFKIDLSHNFLTSDSMYFFGTILGNCSNLITLNLSFNHLGYEGGIVLFKNLIQLKNNSE